MKLILASKSKWRRDVAQKHLGLPIETTESGCDEKEIIKTHHPHTPQEHVLLISKGKLHSVRQLRKNNFDKDKSDEIILCYDTIVYCKGEVLEKPVDDNDLKRMVNLWGKQGEITSIFTAISIGKLSNEEEDFNKVERADVKFLRDFTQEEYNDYINDETVKSSSGAYIIEKLLEYKIAEIIEGSMDIIEGFPIEETKRAISILMK